MGTRKKPQLHILVGTKKGAFILTSDLKRKRWALNGPFLKGAEVNDIVLDARGKPTLFACATSYWFGSTIQYSTNFGKTWTQPEGGIRFPEDSGKNVARTWCVLPGRESEPETLYAGVDPGALFVSRDRGKSWSHVESLTNHPTRERWNPGNAGLMVHSIALHPKNPVRMYVGISAAGVFRTDDGGRSWEPRNKGVRADFLPDTLPEVGQCVHHLEMHPATPSVLYQQNHCGVYRSDNEGTSWVDISDGLPSRFGFPIQIHPHDPDTVYVIPEEGGEFRAVVGGEFAVYRSRNRGKSWKKLGKGLPRKNVYLHVHRQCLKMDSCDPAGVYVGTSSGQIFYSRDEGKSWTLLIENLPMIYSINIART